jgi:uncharacterized protein
VNISEAKLVTHASCMDGSACAILFIAAGGLKENIHFVSPNHRDVDEVISDLLETWSGPIILADISISLKLAKKVGRSDVVLLDHHKSSIPLANFKWCEIDKENTRCGSMMFYDWLLYNMIHPPPIFVNYENLVTLVDDNDRWIRAYSDSGSLALFHEVLGQDLFVDRFLKNPDPILDMMEHYALNLEISKRDKYIERKKKQVQVIEREINGHKVRLGFVASGTHQSLLGNMICDDPELNVDIAVLVGSSISLRASKACPVDLSVVAKLNGGGGHQAASGCSLDKMLGKSLVEYVIDNLKLQQQ